MKRFFLWAAAALLSSSMTAQDYSSIKNSIILAQYKKAKEDIDKAMGNDKFASKPEAFVLKAAVYAALANDPATGVSQKDEWLNTADASFRKYRDMEPPMSFIKDPLYQNCPINIYSGYYTSGYNDYSAKKWDMAFTKLKKAVDYSDILLANKLMTAPIDTNVLILAGITAENSGHTGDAAKYYGRLADKRITGDGFESVYRFLVSYYFQQKDMASFEKYKGIGAAVYPGSDYFGFDAVDFAVGLEPDFSKKIKTLEEIGVSRPNDFKSYEVMGELIYDTLNPKKEDAVPPANAAELEKKMIIAFNKAASLKPGYANPYIYIGDHFISKTVGIDDTRQKLAAELKTKAKPSSADLARKDALDQDYGSTLNKAKEPYENAAAIFAKMQPLKDTDKQQYKKVLGYLADIANYNKLRVRSNPAEQSKWAAEEKKWNDILQSIR